jgi:hypothetical protein
MWRAQDINFDGAVFFVALSKMSFPYLTGLVRRGGGGAVPNTGPLRTAAANYFKAARNAGVNKANLSAVNSAIKNLARKAYGAAQAPLNQQPPTEALAAPAPVGAAPNYGLAQAYANLRNKLQKANKTGLEALIVRGQAAMNASKNNTTASVAGVRSNLNAQIKKANALNRANTGLQARIKGFLEMTANAAKKNNADYNTRLNLSFNALGNDLKPIFKANYNKAKAAATKTVQNVVQQVPPPRSITISGTKYFVSNVNKALKNANVKTVYALSNNGTYIGGTRARSGFGPFAKNIVTLGTNKFNWNGKNFRAH